MRQISQITSIFLPRKYQLSACTSSEDLFIQRQLLNWIFANNFLFPLLKNNLIHGFEGNKLLMSFYRTDSVTDFIFFWISIRTKQDSSFFMHFFDSTLSTAFNWKGRYRIKWWIKFLFLFNNGTFGHWKEEECNLNLLYYLLLLMG